MRIRQRPASVIPVAAAAGLFLAGCGTQAPAGTVSDVPPSSSAPAAPPAAPGSVTYTFPDGRLSFAHPADWHVQHDQVSASPSVETATVSDAGGKAQVNIYYSAVGDATAGPGTRFVLAADPVPGLVGHSVPTAHSSFFVDHSGGAVQYRMGLTAGLPVAADGKLQDAPVVLGGRMLTADVLFTTVPFADDEAAKAWYWSGEGQTLKALLMSFSYR